MVSPGFSRALRILTWPRFTLFLKITLHLPDSALDFINQIRKGNSKFDNIKFIETKNAIMGPIGSGGKLITMDCVFLFETLRSDMEVYL